MNKVATSLAVVAMALCVGCKKDPVPTIDTQKQECQFTSCKASNDTLMITTNYAWTIAAPAEDWLKISPLTGEAGETMLTVAVTKNLSLTPRDTQFDITSQDKSVEITITQSGLSSDYTIVENHANCYMLGTDGNYVLDFSVKGNSDEAINGGVSVSLLWQDAKSLVADLSYNADAHLLAVTTGNNEGNAVVAVKDAAGTILWSWHLWVTNYTPGTSDFTTEANASGTIWSFMDRNLGALSATPADGLLTHGLIYQWGRKDPFTSAIDYTVQNEDYSYQVDGEPTVYDINNNAITSKPYQTAAGNGSVELSIANPTIFYTGLSHGSKDWSATSDDDRWGGVSQKKSIYDPCPAGYKVPVCDISANTPYAWMIYANMVWDTKDFGAIDHEQWFPAVGTRVYASGGCDNQSANPYGGMWIGTAGKASSNLEEFPDLYGQYMFIINGKRTYKVSKDSRSQGLSVRCVAE